jgi:hypothetical protein
MSGWATHILALDPMSPALRQALEAGHQLGTELRNELSILERRGPCPPGADGWEFNASGGTRRRCQDQSDPLNAPS